MLSNEEKNEIVTLRKAGIGYKRIANELELTRDTVRGFCRRAGLAGVVNTTHSNLCNQCGKPVMKKHTGRPRRFCSDECRHEWWIEHPEALSPDPEAIYKIACAHCGEIFESYGNINRKYCCHEHYIAARFNKELSDNIKTEYPVLSIKSLNQSILVNPNKLRNTNLPDDLFLNRIFLICCKSGFHGKFDKLAGRIPHILEMNLMNGDAFVFCNWSKFQISILQWQGDGFALYFKRSDYVGFPWPKNARADALEITHSDLKMLLEYPRFLLRLSGEEIPSAII